MKFRFMLSFVTQLRWKSGKVEMVYSILVKQCFHNFFLRHKWRLFEIHEAVVI